MSKLTNNATMKKLTSKSLTTCNQEAISSQPCTAQSDANTTLKQWKMPCHKNAVRGENNESQKARGAFFKLQLETNEKLAQTMPLKTIRHSECSSFLKK